MLSADQKEILQEIANIGMGQAGASIAQVLDHFVRLSVPRILFVQRTEIAQALQTQITAPLISAVRQAFHSDFRGEAVVIFDIQGGNILADLMGYEQDLDRPAELELLLDISNLLVGACLGGIAEQLHGRQGNMRFSPPALMTDRQPLTELFAASDPGWHHALLVEVNFSLEERNFACHLVILMAENEIRNLARALDQFMESFGG